MLNKEKIHYDNDPQATPSDEELVARFLMEQRPHVADDGFTERVMQQLPRTHEKAFRLWTAICALMLVAFVVALAVSGKLFDWIHLPSLQQIVAGLITLYTRLQLVHFNPLLILGACSAVVIAVVVNIVGWVNDDKRFTGELIIRQLECEWQSKNN